MTSFSTSLSRLGHWIEDNLWLVIGLGVVVAVAAGLFFWSSDRSLSSAVATERSNLNRIRLAVEGRHSSTGYADLTTASAIADRLVPSAMLPGKSGQIRNVWGTPVDLSPHQVKSPGDGFSVIYRGIPQQDCISLAREMGARVYDMRIGGQGVMGVDGPEMQEVSSRCTGSQGAVVEFIFNSRFVPGTALPRA